MIKLKPLLMESFTEVNFHGTNPVAEGDVVFVHYDESWEPIHAYVDRDSPLVKFNPDDWEVSNPEELAEYKWRWKRNGAFYHLISHSHINSFVWWIDQLGYVEARDV